MSLICRLQNKVVFTCNRKYWAPVYFACVSILLCSFLVPAIAFADEPENTTTDTSSEVAPVDCNAPVSDCGSGPLGADSGPVSYLNPQTNVGNPINLVTGNKYEGVQDYGVSGTALEFSRHYNSGRADISSGLGNGWTSSFGSRIKVLPDAGYLITDGTGRRFEFDNASEDENGSIRFYETGSATNGYVSALNNVYQWHIPDGRKITFNGSFLVRIDYPGHKSLELFYKKGRLAEVRDEADRSIQFTYEQSDSGLAEFSAGPYRSVPGFLKTLILPDRSTIHYDYDHAYNLARVRYSDGTSTLYHYEDEAYPSHLTGITDRSGSRYASWEYNAAGMAVSSEHADGVERVTLEYELPSSENDIGTTYVTNSEGRVTEYRWRHVKSASSMMLLNATGPGCITCPRTNKKYTYTDDFKLSSEESLNGTKQYYYYDDNNRLERIERSEAFSSKTVVVARYEYDKDGSTPVSTYTQSINGEGEFQTAIKYNSEQLPIEITESGFAPVLPSPSTRLASLYAPVSRTTKLAYESGLLTQVDGPRENVNDITNFQYDNFSRLTQIDLPSGESIQILKYDEHGRVLELKRSGHPEISLHYDRNGNVLRVTQLGQSVTYAYSAENQLVSITNRNGKTSVLEYDNARRLIGVTDDVGRVVELTLNGESQIADKSFYGIDGSLINSISYVFDADSRIQTVNQNLQNHSNSEPVNRSLDIEYDEFGNLVGAADNESGMSQDYAFSSLGRLLNVSQPNGLSIRKEYDIHDRLISYTDKRLNATQYYRDDFGDIHFQVSPDTGTTEYDYDLAGNRVLKKNANGEVSRYKWDAANRLVEQKDDSGKTSYVYSADNGRLLETSNAATTELFSYTTLAQLKRHTRIIDGHEFSTQYAYQENGKLQAKTLPDGQTLRYHYYQAGALVGSLRAITREELFGLKQSTLVGEIDLDPRDGYTSFLSHNGHRNEYEHFSDGKISALTISDSLRLEYTYNKAGKIVGINRDGVDQQYDYDSGQLKRAETVTGSYSYDYDVAGNRIKASQVNSIENTDLEIEQDIGYDTPGKGNRLQSVIDSKVGSEIVYRYNEAGSPIKRGEFRYKYNAEQRPIAVYQGDELLAKYGYNSFGERIRKVTYSNNLKKVTYFLYDNRKLVAEVDGESLVYKQTVYLKNTPVIHLIGNEAFAVHSDNLGTPKQLSDELGNTVWSAAHTPLGKAVISNEQITFNLRLPGQYADLETGTHYNYFRDYDPATGRYLTSDPIGIEGGDNTYAYAKNDVLGLTDILGLSPNLPSALLIADLSTNSDSGGGTGTSVQNPNTLLPDAADFGITDPDQLVTEFFTIGSPCDSAQGIEYFNDGITRTTSSTDDDITPRYMANGDIQYAIDVLRWRPNTPNFELVKQALVNWEEWPDSKIILVPHCATYEDVERTVKENLGNLVLGSEIQGMFEGLGPEDENGCRPAGIVDVTDLYDEVLVRVQILVATDPAVTAAEKALILAQEALDDFFRLHPELENPRPQCLTGQSSRNNTAITNTYCGLRNAVADRSEALANAMADVYEALEDSDKVPPYDTREAAAEFRKQVMLGIVGVFVPLTATDLAIEAATFGFGKVARLFGGAATLIRSITRVNRAGLDDIVARGSEAATRANKIKIEAEYPNLTGLGDLDYADVVRIENSVGADKLTKLSDEMARSPELASAMDANPRLAVAWRMFDDAAESACSFDGSMEVLTNNGNVPIQDIRAGVHYVLSKDEKTGAIDYKAVTAAYSNRYDKQIYITSVNDVTGDYQTVVSNEIHPIFAIPVSPFLSVSSEGHFYEGDVLGGQWIDASDLNVGDKLLNAESGYSTVKNVEKLDKEFTAFNLTVADYHTYFISQPNSDTSYWVHNSCFNYAAVKNDPDALQRLTTDVDGAEGLEAALSANNNRLMDQWVLLKDSPRRTNVGSLEFFADPKVQQTLTEVRSRDLTAQYPDIPLEELVAIRHYTTDAYTDLNRALRDGNPTDTQKAFEEMVNEGLSKLPDITVPVVYRGVSGGEAAFARTWQVGDTPSFTDFKSSSTSETTAADFSGGEVIYEITNPKGKSICEISCYPEAEVLFQSDSSFVVKEIVEQVEVTDRDDNVMVVTKIVLEYID